MKELSGVKRFSGGLFPAEPQTPGSHRSERTPAPWSGREVLPRGCIWASAPAGCVTPDRSLGLTGPGPATLEVLDSESPPFLSAPVTPAAVPLGLRSGLPLPGSPLGGPSLEGLEQLQGLGLLSYEVRPASLNPSFSLFLSFAAHSGDQQQWHRWAVMEEGAPPQARNESDSAFEQAPKVVCGHL